MAYRKSHIKPRLRKLRKRKKLWKQPLFWFTVLLVCVVAGVSYLALWLPWLAVSRIQVSGNQTVAAAAIDRLVADQLKKDGPEFGPIHLPSPSVLAVNDTRIRASLLSAFPQLANAVVRAQLPNQLTVLVQERQAAATWCGQQNPFGNCFSIDQNGIAFAPVDAPPNGLPIIDGAGVNASVLGRQVADASVAAAAVAADKTLNDAIGVRVAEVSGNNPLVLTTSEGWKVYIDPATNLSDQLTGLATLFANTITPDRRKTLQYIYLQYPGKAYYQ